MLHSAWFRVTVAVLGLSLLGRALPRFGLLQGLLRHTLHTVRVRPVPRDDVREAVRELFEAVATELAPHGFRPVAYCRVRPLQRNALPEPSLLLHAPERSTWAWITPTSPLEPARPVAVELDTDFTDGVRLVSVDLDTDALDTPDVVVLETMATTVGEHVAAHAGRCAELEQGRRIADLDLDAFLDRTARRWEAFDGALRAAGLTEPLPGQAGQSRWTLRGAWTLMRRVAAATPRLRRLLAAKARAGQRWPVPVELEVDALERTQTLGREPVPRALGLAVVAVLGVLFVASMLGFFEPVTIAIVMAVLVVHELGHHGATRALGHRDTRLFFAPFLGAATWGRKERASATEDVLVLLAGPLPGIAIGLGLWLLDPAWGARGEVWTSSVSLLVGLNLLTLLPLFPLDGGRLVHRLLTSRAPRLEVVLRLVAVAVFSAGAILLDDGLPLILALLVAAGIGRHARVARLEASLRRREAHTLPEHERLRAILERLREERSITSARRLPVAHQLAERLAKPPARWRVAAPGLAVYAACLVVPTGLWLTGIAPTVRSPAPASHEPWSVEVSCATDPDERRASLTAARGEPSLVFDPRFAGDPPADLVEELTLAQHASQYACARMPWDGDLSAAERRARRTVVRLDEAVAEAPWPGDDVVPDDPKAFVAFAKERRAEIRRAYAETHADDPDLDLDTVELVIAAPEDRSSLEALVDRLGRGACVEDPGEMRSMLVQVAHDERDQPIVGQPARGAGAVVDYLCEAGATGVEVRDYGLVGE